MVNIMVSKTIDCSSILQIPVHAVLAQMAQHRSRKPAFRRDMGVQVSHTAFMAS